MEESKTLILEFLDEDDKKASIVVKDPADDLKLSEVSDVMDVLIENDAILTASGKHLDSSSSCYYKTITLTPLTDEAGK